MNRETAARKRPVNLDLKTVRFPITAIVSILHRVSGVIMFVALAILLALLAESLSSEEGFNNAVAIVDNWFVGFIMWGILTALAYHICAGIRHLVMDFGYFEEMDTASKSAKVTFIATGVLSLLAGVLVW